MKLRLLLLVFSAIIVSGCAREWDEVLLIAFNNGTDVYIMNEDGSDIRKMTNGGSCSHPAFSPDGKMLVYWRTGTLYTMNIEEKQEKFLHGATLQFSTWSPDGTKIAFFDTSSRLSTINPDGTNYTVINTATNYTGPISWSSDSGTIACINTTGSVITYINLSNPLVPAPMPPSNVTGLSFSPDNDEIAYTQSGNLYISARDFSSTRTITTSGADLTPSWSSDGTRLVYVNAGSIRTINSKGGTPDIIAGPGNSNPCYRYKPH